MGVLAGCCARTSLSPVPWTTVTRVIDVGVRIKTTPLRPEWVYRQDTRKLGFYTNKSNDNRIGSLEGKALGH